MKHYDDIISQAQNTRAAGSVHSNPYPAGSTLHAFYEHGWNLPKMSDDLAVAASEIKRLRSELEYARTFETAAAYQAGRFEGGIDALQAHSEHLALLQDARHRVANLSRAQVPFEDPLDGPVLRRLDEATSKLRKLRHHYPPLDNRALVRHPAEQIQIWADMYMNMGGHGLMVDMLLAYGAIASQCNALPVTEVESA